MGSHETANRFQISAQTVILIGRVDIELTTNGGNVFVH